jgi:predicted TPR repeat methyltransferase
MPGSIRENDADVIKFVQENNIKRVLDVGTGRGTYSDLLREHVDFILGVEIWEPYIEEFNLHSKYDKLVNDDIRTWPSFFYEGYDLVIFGDVLEHMTSHESRVVWTKASSAKFGLISVPIVHYPQGEQFGNPYEEHVQEHMHPEDIRKFYGPFVFDKEYEITGTFIRDFSRNRLA